MQWNPSDLKVENVVTGSIAKVAQDRLGIIARSVSAAAGSFVVLLPVRSRHSLTTVQVGQAKRICLLTQKAEVRISLAEPNPFLATISS
jgi:hypothetical protein